MREGQIRYASIGFGLLACMLGLLACHHQQTPVVVHVFRDRDGAVGKNINAAILAIGLQHLTTSDGSPIVIATYELPSYKDALPTLGTKLRPDVVVFNYQADWLASQLGAEPKNLRCARQQICAAAIPSWTTGKNRDASERVLALIGTKLDQSVDVSRPTEQK